ncbi:FAD-dependent oxidoreductase [Paenibacillus koleovorans]|uniref:FAD-dependent oxidoreductase n=1 Tax=Paenibacillus koleovorans TaxID=121608 RepID=UPI000FD7416F|nr:FAD-dependent oxidoreductase [Paenibacillus koleovorans]
MNIMRASTRKKRDYVLEVAFRMFAERGYEHVSVDDIIAATNTSKGTFYHYFDGKEDLLSIVSERQIEVVEQWVKETPAKVQSLESHVNRLFLDLASNIQSMPRLIRSIQGLAMHNETAAAKSREQLRHLTESLLHWLPERHKVDLLISAYSGIVNRWCMSEDTDLESRVRTQFALLWTGLRSSDPPSPLEVAPKLKEEPKMKVAVIGGGLAGLTAAAYLSEESSIEGILFERSPQLGGRAFTYEKAGFTLNYGAHAIYGIDRHTLTVMEKELGLSFSSKQVDRRKVVYEKNNQLTQAPLDFVNLMKTDLLSPVQKVRFAGEITAIIANIHQLKHYKTLGDYLAYSNADEDLKELWEHLVCSNFFITPEDARLVSGAVISEYYHNLFLSTRPVNYVLGSWAVITNQLKSKIELSGRWAISLQEGVDGIRYEGGRFVLQTKTREESFDRIVFAMPVQQVTKLLKGTAWEPFLAPYEHNTSTEVMVYDVGLKRVVARPFSYISDMDNKMFISDVSATDHTLVPEQGQLLQGIAYLSDQFADDAERKAYLERKTEQIEQLFDKHYAGWRDEVAVKRVSKKAMVASVKNVHTNKLLPTRVENMPFYFCGDGCTGKGELAERAFSSARQVAQGILKDTKQLVGAGI